MWVGLGGGLGGASAVWPSCDRMSIHLKMQVEALVLLSSVGKDGAMRGGNESNSEGPLGIMNV